MENLLSETIGARVRSLRADRHISINRLAQMCADAGTPELTRAALYALESGRRDEDGRRVRMVSVDEWMALSAAFGVLPDELLPLALLGDGRVCSCPSKLRRLADELEGRR